MTKPLPWGGRVALLLLLPIGLLPLFARVQTTICAVKLTRAGLQ